MTPPSKATGFWSPSAWYCAEVLHILAGALVVVAGALHGLTPWMVLAGLVVVAGVKEFTIDVSPFEGDSWWGSTQDFFFYCVVGSGGFLAAVSFFWIGGIVVVAGILLCMVVDMLENACLKNSAGQWVPWQDVI
jgi:hypothetical protein